MKKQLFPFLFFLICFTVIAHPVSAFGQVNVDSLLNILDKNNEKDNSEVYYELLDFYILNSPEKAIDFANKLLTLSEKNGNTEAVDYSYEILGEAYYYQGSYDIALGYFNKFLESKIKQENEAEIANAYNKLGVIYRAMDDFPKAIEYYKNSLGINKRLENKKGLSSTYNNLGVLHEHLNLFSQARDYYFRSLDIEKSLGDMEGVSTSFLNLGGINFKMRNHDKAIDFCNRSIAICDSLDYILTLEMNYEVLYKTFKSLKDIDKSLFYLEQYYKLKNKRVSKEISSRITELEIKYATNKKEQEIVLLTRQKKHKTIFNIIILTGLAGLAIFILLLYRINKFRKKKSFLLQQRNIEITLQKEEIETQKDELEAQRDEIEAQRNEISKQKEISDSQHYKIKKQNKDITDSIEYAKHIQMALLTDKITLQKAMKRGFCLFKPKDIVSGDFYWATEMDNKSVIVAADCTGHGVPGAFMSIMGINFLNGIIFDEKILKPNEILNQLRKKIIKTLVSADKIEKSKDGMDISLVVIDYKKMQLEYAGAYNNLFYIRDNMLEVIKADKMPIGLSERGIQSFTNHIIDIEKGDVFYMFTDGYADQFGGPNRKKFRVGNLKELLLEIHDKDIIEQKRILHEEFINWKGDQPQVDDVLSIGIEII